MTQPIASMTCAGFLEALASKAPTPGGGAVAGLIGATAAALGEMVAVYSLGRSDDDETESALRDITAELSRARGLFLTLADEDAAAYAVLNAAFKLPKSDPGRMTSILAGANAAIQPPRATLAACADVARLLERLLPISNRNLSSDLRIAASLTIASADAAICNIDANANLLGETGAGITREACALANDISKRAGLVESACMLL
ncbi:MAG: cyclodeaminase/cyclohydrolase family protein [Phycisphaeraceae bacterium]|nr:cyclodeaminase/cyclohydrolase family protein [Phycisphaeraceae bacterium]